MKLVITAVRNAHFIVYWYNEENTDLYKGDVIVPDAGIVTFMYDYPCCTMKSSTRIGVSGARPHRHRTVIPVESKMFCMLCIQLMERYIKNSIGILAMKILYVYIYSVIN